MRDNELIGGGDRVIGNERRIRGGIEYIRVFFTGLIHAKQKFIKNYLVDRFDCWNLFIDIVNFIAGEIE